jgi:succinate dehydrogenase/fumarate reductase flavoprotein subunit
MLSFTPFSTNPISDIQLPAITGTINVTDSNDTATFTGSVGYPVDNGTISATDSNDTASITGSVGVAPATGTISATDGNDTADITGFVGVPVTGDTHDGFTPQEIKRAKALDAKIAKLERQRLEVYRKSQADRKSTIKELVDPTPKNKQKKNKVQSNQEVSEDIPSEITVLDNTIANLVKQQQELLHGVMLRQELVRIQTEMAILEAKRMQELDDEEALLLLL